MIGIIIFLAVLWLILTLLQPLWAVYSAKRKCDRIYGPGRERRAREYEELLRQCQADSHYFKKQMAVIKQKKNKR